MKPKLLLWHGFRWGSLSLLFEIHDLWIGAYWKTYWAVGHRRSIDLYICLVPTLPIRLTWHRGRPA